MNESSWRGRIRIDSHGGGGQRGIVMLGVDLERIAMVGLELELIVMVEVKL